MRSLQISAHRENLRTKRLRGVSEQSKKDLKTGFPPLTVRKMEREPTKETGGGRGEVSFLSLPLPPLLLGRFFTRRFFAPKAHGNACYAATQAI